MVFTRVYNGNELPFHENEALRYYGAKGEISNQVREVFCSCAEESLAVCDYKVCYAVFSVNRGKNAQGEDFLDLGFTRTTSKNLIDNLNGCDSVVAFAATVGIGIDRLIARYSSLSPVKAYAYQAVGAERIETLCDVFDAQIKEEYGKRGLFARPRFSCGYGDFSLEHQPDFFKALDCERKIGLTLTDGLLMTPTKSVTALIGLCNRACGNRDDGKDKCQNCDKKDCRFSAKGDTHA